MIDNSPELANLLLNLFQMVMYMVYPYNDPRTVVLAFPGMGKTTWALEHACVADLDFDYLRQATGVSEGADCSLLEVYSKLIDRHFRVGFETVFINEPRVLPFLKDDVRRAVIVALPTAYAYETICAHLGCSRSQLTRFIAEWRRIAVEYELPAFSGSSLKSILLEEYLECERSGT